jgi:hypothetical protein
MPALRYRVPVRWLFPIASVVWAFVDVVLIVLAFTSAGPPVWFVVLWLGVTGWIGFNFLWRIPYEVLVEDGHLTWRGFFRTQSVPMSDITRLSLAMTGNMQIVERRDGSKLRIAVMQGYGPFIRSVVEAYPDIPIAVGRYSAFVDKVRLQRQDETKAVTTSPEQSRKD